MEGAWEEIEQKLKALGWVLPIQFFRFSESQTSFESTYIVSVRGLSFWFEQQLKLTKLLEAGWPGSRAISPLCIINLTILQARCDVSINLPSFEKLFPNSTNTSFSATNSTTHNASLCLFTKTAIHWCSSTPCDIESDSCRNWEKMGADATFGTSRTLDAVEG